MRYRLLDTLRGISVVSMILFHACWDLVNLYHFDWPWFQGTAGHVWQQSICWTFILLSGFCFRLGSRPVRRGLQVSALGLLVTAVPVLFTPEEHTLTMLAVAIGAGFATFENCCYILTSGAERLTYILIRGLAVGVMHIVSVLTLSIWLIIAMSRRCTRIFWLMSRDCMSMARKILVSIRISGSAP